jgi:hypothetical protein
MEINIILIPFTEDYLIPEDGKYLVRTESRFLKSVNTFQARCKRSWNEKKKRFVTSIDVSNQDVTHISEQPLK